MARLIRNKTKNFNYYYHEFMKIDSRLKVSPKEHIMILREGCPIIGREKYKNRGKRVSKNLKTTLGSMDKSDYKKIRPQYIEFYLERYETDEAYRLFNNYMENRSEISKKAIIKSNEFRRNNPESNNTRLEYFIKKNNGNIEQAKLEHKDRQATSALRNFIKKYGPKEGYTAWRSRNRKWQRTLNSKPMEEQDRINHRKVTKGFSNNISKESNEFFDKLDKDIDYEIVYGSKNIEFSICYNGKNRYYYDCIIPELDIIIEFNGTSFHPKPLRYDWISAYGKGSYKENRLSDLRKHKVAKDRGYGLIVIWSDDRYEKSVSKIRKAINERLARSI